MTFKFLLIQRCPLDTSSTMSLCSNSCSCSIIIATGQRPTDATRAQQQPPAVVPLQVRPRVKFVIASPADGSQRRRVRMPVQGAMGSLLVSMEGHWRTQSWRYLSSNNDNQGDNNHDNLHNCKQFPLFSAFGYFLA